MVVAVGDAGLLEEGAEGRLREERPYSPSRTGQPVAALVPATLAGPASGKGKDQWLVTTLPRQIRWVVKTLAMLSGTCWRGASHWQGLPSPSWHLHPGSWGRLLPEVAQLELSL